MAKKKKSDNPICDVLYKKKNRRYSVIMLLAIIWGLLIVIIVIGLPESVVNESVTEESVMPLKSTNIIAQYDTYVDFGSGNMDENYGETDTLYSSPTQYVYLRYDLSTFADINILRIDFHIKQIPFARYWIRVASPRWDENTITAQVLTDNENHDPPIQPRSPSSDLQIFLFHAEDYLYLRDIRNHVGLSDDFCLSIQSSSSVSYNSRESGLGWTSRQPYLTIHYTGVASQEIVLISLTSMVMLGLLAVQFKWAKQSEFPYIRECV